jgi:hypothetical protein
MKSIRTVASLALILLAAGGAGAEDSQPVSIQAKAIAESPFKLAVPSARLIYEDDGTTSLAFDLKVTNVKADRLVTASGWALDVASPAGELLQRVNLTSVAEIEPLQSRTLSYRLGAKALGPVTASSKLTIRPASQGVRDITALLCLDSVTCESQQYACAQQCGNPLVGEPGAAVSDCTCGKQWDQARKCWRDTCLAHCLCNGRPTPPQNEPFVTWGN